MSHISQAQQGIKAVDNKNWDEALTKLSAALKVSQNPKWLVVRSKALVGLQRYAEALDDADLAWHCAYQRNMRPVMLEAHHRRAVAYFRLRAYADADCCCVYAMRLAKGLPALEKEDPGWLRVGERGFWRETLQDAQEESRNDSMNKADDGMGMAMGQSSQSETDKDLQKDWRAASMLRMQILFAMQKLPEDDAARRLTTFQKPAQKDLLDLTSKGQSVGTASASTTAAAAQPTAQHVVPNDTPLRLQEFQSKTTMSVSIFSKGVDKDKLKVDFLPQAVRLDPVTYPSGDEGSFQLEMWGEIDASASKYAVTAKKVELTLAKKTQGMWKSLYSETKKTELVPGKMATSGGEGDLVQEGKDETVESAEALTNTTTAPSQPTLDTTSTASKAETSTAAGPSYPTSSKAGPRDWDKFAGDGDDDVNSDNEEDRDVNFFFKKLYKNATPEQQRAMMKSFTESNGTSLSTDWNSVKDKVVETVPPDGVEAKKWEK